MYTYPNFEKEVIRVFAGLMNRYNLEAISLSNNHFSEVRLKNNNCIIKFTYNMGEVGCSFINPKAISGIYPIYPIWSFLYPNDQKEYGLHEFDFEKQLYFLADLISERFAHILMGDFSWVNDFENKNHYLSKQIEFIMNKLENDSPIKAKFWNADLSWKEDLRDYINSKHINIDEL